MLHGFLVSGVLQIVKAQPTPIESTNGTMAAVEAAPNMYCTMYLLQTTSALSAGKTSFRDVNRISR